MTMREIKRVWYTSSEEVWMFGNVMLGAHVFDVASPDFAARNTTADNLLDYFEKPWHWTRQHAWWMANDRTDDVAKWELGRDAEWEVWPE